MAIGSRSKENTPIVVEASWAPADPRDKLYDDKASKAEKSVSVFRIVASFHPVLNLPVLAYDSFRSMGWVRAIAMWFLILLILCGLILLLL